MQLDITGSKILIDLKNFPTGPLSFKATGVSALVDAKLVENMPERTTLITRKADPRSSTAIK